jgi:hypothetical protein
VTVSSVAMYGTAWHPQIVHAINCRWNRVLIVNRVDRKGHVFGWRKARQTNQQQKRKRNGTMHSIQKSLMMKRSSTGSASDALALQSQIRVTTS